MNDSIKLAIIGDFNFAYNTHHASNLAIDHASNFLDTEINYYWIKVQEVVQSKKEFLQSFDGVWIAPGPYKNEFYLREVLDLVYDLEIPVFITGEAFKVLMELLIIRYNINPNGEKLISDNLVELNRFEKIEVVPHSKALIHLYNNHNSEELCTSRYSMYPKLVNFLNEVIIDVEAYNHFEDVEIFSLKKSPFFVVCSFLPQISSTREIPHPLIYTFINACINLKSK